MENLIGGGIVPHAIRTELDTNILGCCVLGDYLW